MFLKVLTGNKADNFKFGENNSPETNEKKQK